MPSEVVGTTLTPKVLSLLFFRKSRLAKPDCVLVRLFGGVLQISALDPALTIVFPPCCSIFNKSPVDLAMLCDCEFGCFCVMRGELVVIALGNGGGIKRGSGTVLCRKLTSYQCDRYMKISIGSAKQMNRRKNVIRFHFTVGVTGDLGPGAALVKKSEVKTNLSGDTGDPTPMDGHLGGVLGSISIIVVAFSVSYVGKKCFQFC